MKSVLLHLSHTDIRYDSRILKELRALEALAGYEIKAVGVDADEGASAANVHVLRARIVAIRLVTKLFTWLPRALRYTLSMLELTARFFWHGLRMRPTAVHCHDTLVLPAGVLIRLVTRCKLIYDAHELESNKNGQTRILSWGTLALEKFSWQWIDLLVSVSDSILEWYSRNLGPKAQVLVLNSPEVESHQVTDLAQPRPARYFHQLYGIPSDRLVFVYLGILAPGRGIEMTLEAFASSTIDAHVVFVGYGELAERISSYSGKYQNIHLHKPVPHDQVVTLVSGADVGLCLIENVSLSDYYCLPNKLFEYSFAGLHMLASDFPEIRKVVEQYSLGACCELESQKIREAIQQLVDHPPAKMQADLSPLSWSAQAERLVNAYHRLLDIQTESAPMFADASQERRAARDI